MTENSSDHHFTLTVNLAIEALKALLLVNGGAATALIALTEKAHSGSNFTTATVLFGAAALLIAATFVVGYFSQLAYANHRLAVEQSDTGDAEKQSTTHRICQGLAAGFVIISLGISGWAMICAFIAASAPHVVSCLP